MLLCFGLIKNYKLTSDTICIKLCCINGIQFPPKMILLHNHSASCHKAEIPIFWAKNDDESSNTKVPLMLDSLRT